MAAQRIRQFVRKELVWWVLPPVVVLALLAAFLVLVEGSALAPLIYSMF